MTVTITHIHPSDAYWDDRQDFFDHPVDARNIRDEGGGWFSLEFGTGAAAVAVSLCRFEVV
jgi:hypothetical protein